MKFLAALLFICVVVMGCAMFGTWRTIPPPGGCGVCHTRPITADWAVAYEPATISDERDEYPWQKPEAMMPPESSPIEERKISEERCFRCHKGPDKAHTQYRGRYHH